MAPGTELRSLLSEAQVEAARQVHETLTQWAVTDSALDALARALPDFGLDASLLKVAAVNQLYGTNLLAVVRMAQHVTSIMASPPSGVELVERLATLAPAPGGSGKGRRHVSFASKFAHFFVSPDYAIYDSFAVQALARRVKGPAQSTSPDYPRFVAELALLKEGSRLRCSNRDVDRYLWLAGLWAAWRKNRAAPINAEVARLFEASRSDAKLSRRLALLAAE